jgi:hypothetical protein
MARGESHRKIIHRAKDAFAWVEYELDCFLISILRVCGPTERKKIIPLGMVQKLDMLFDFFRRLPQLREFGLYDGSLDLNKMNYWLSEISDHRNHMIHGHLEVSGVEENDVVFIFRRHIREDGALGGFGKWNWQTSRSYVRSQIQVAEMLALYFRDASKFLEGKIDRDYYAARAKKQALQKEWWSNEGQFMGLVLPDNLKGLEPLINGELAPA